VYLELGHVIYRPDAIFIVQLQQLKHSSFSVNLFLLWLYQAILTMALIMIIWQPLLKNVLFLLYEMAYLDSEENYEDLT